MEKIKFNLTDDELKEIIFQVVDEEKYWINQITRLEFDSLDGTVISLKPRKAENALEPIEIQFLHGKLDVSGLSVSEIRKMYKLYYDKIFEKVPEYADRFNQSKELIQEFLKEYNQMLNTRMADVLFESGLDLDFVKNKVKMYRLAGVTQEEVKIGNHVTFRILPPNKFDVPEREIKVGSIYFGDLDPVVGAEFGGVRPCLVIGHTADKKSYFVIPFSTKEHLGIQAGEISDLKSYAVVSRMKIISPQRLYDHVGDVGDELYTEIIKEVNKSHIIYAKPEVKEASLVSLTKDEKEIKEAEEVGAIPELINNIEPPNRNTLSIELIDNNLIQLSEGEIYQLIEKWASIKRRDTKMNFIGAKGGKLQYSYEEQKDRVIVRLNEKHSEPAKGYFPVKIEFLRHEAYFSINEDKGKRDANLTLVYQKRRLEKDEKYAISLFTRYVRLTYYSYRNLAENDLDGSILDEKIEQLKSNLKKVGITYDGNFEDLVLKGDRAIVIEFIHYDENQSEIE